MGRTLIRDTCPLAAEIMEGGHDDVLDYILQAAEARKKNRAMESGIRKHARIRIVDTPEATDLAGREGKVVSVNKKSVTVELDPLHETDYRTGWRIPHVWVEAA